MPNQTLITNYIPILIPICTVPNYHVELEFWPHVKSAEFGLKQPTVIRLKTKSGHILKASFDLTADRPVALLVDYGKPSKIKDARISDRRYHGLVKSIKIKYLSHTDPK